MWLFTTDGFFSVVCASEGHGNRRQSVDLNLLMIRARARSHLVNLKRRFPDLLKHHEILQSHSSDYAFRIVVQRDVWQQVLLRFSERIDYGNSKGAVADKRQPGNRAYEQSLHDVWEVMRQLQTHDGDERSGVSEFDSLSEMRDAFGDPEPRDPNDPDFKDEVFQLCKDLGNRPEDFVNDPTFAREYAEWLKTAKSDGE
jgi:hypothetical protein